MPSSPLLAQWYTYSMLAVAFVGMSTLACLRAISDASVSAAARGSRPVGGAPSVQAPATPARPRRTQLDNYQSRQPACTGYYNNTVNVVSTVHCLFGGVAPAVHCRARCRKSRKKRRGARRSCSSSSSRRRGDRRAAAAGHGTAARRSRAAATAAHPTHDAERSTPAALGRARPLHAYALSSALKCHTGASGSRRREQREPSHL